MIRYHYVALGVNVCAVGILRCGHGSSLLFICFSDKTQLLLWIRSRAHLVFKYFHALCSTCDRLNCVADALTIDLLLLGLHPFILGSHKARRVLAEVSRHIELLTHELVHWWHTMCVLLMVFVEGSVE